MDDSTYSREITLHLQYKNRQQHVDQIANTRTRKHVKDFCHRKIANDTTV